MKHLVHAIFVSVLAATAGGAAGSVTVNGTDISAGSGDGWTAETQNPYGDWSLHVHLTHSGPFVVSGTDVSGKTVLRAETDCTVVVSNLVLSNVASGYRLHGDGIGVASAIATNGMGQSVAVLSDGLYHSSVGIGTFFPEDPATAHCRKVFTWSDVWDPSNVSWTPYENSAAVAWAGERFVAARFRGDFLVSDDGVEWRPATWNGTPYNLRAIARNPDTGTLVAASTKGLWTSRDGGLSWAQSTNLSSYAVVRSDGLFVAVGNSKGAPQGVFWSADDGATWRARYFSDQDGALEVLVAGGGGTFLSGNDNGWRALHLENGEMVSDGTQSMTSTKFAVASDGNGRYVACSGPDTGIRESTGGLAWARSTVTNSTFYSLLFRGGKFVAEGVRADGRYTRAWYKGPPYDDWVDPLLDDCGQGRSALVCGTNAVKLVVSGTGNRLAGGPYVPAVSVNPGGTLELSAADAGPAAIDVRGGCYAAAIGGGWFDYGAGSFVQRSATLFAKGGARAPDIGSFSGDPSAEGATILGGSLCPAGWRIDPAPSNGVEAVRCVVVQALEPGARVTLSNLPWNYGTNGIVADAYGCVYLWLPAAAETFRFIAGGALRRVAAGGGDVLVETLPDPKVEAASFAAAPDGAMEVTLRVSSPVEAEALEPAYATDLATLAAGGGKLDPTKVEEVGEGAYELTFRLPDEGDSGFLVIRAK